MTNLKLVTDRLEQISFPLVHEASLYAGMRSTPVLSHKAIQNEHGVPIAVVGKGYTTVQNNDAFSQIEDAIYASAINTTGMIRDIKESHDGARTIVTYSFPAHKVDINDKGDNVMLTIKVLNSYDGSWRLMTLVGAVRQICENGMVIGEYFSEYFQKHTKNIDIESAVQKMGHALEVFGQNAELWTAYPSTKVSDLEATNILTRLAGGSKTLLELLQQTHVEYVDELGKNLWALFNTLTDWSSHAKFKNEKNKASTIITREAKVRKVLPMLEALRKAA
mgnify:FL=1|jgi:hypothetical protein